MGNYLLHSVKLCFRVEEKLAWVRDAEEEPFLKKKPQKNPTVCFPRLCPSLNVGPTVCLSFDTPVLTQPRGRAGGGEYPPRAPVD